MFLAISHKKDTHTTLVLKQLQRIGIKSRLLDISEYPKNLHLSSYYHDSGSYEASIYNHREKLNFSDYSVIWWRRPQPLNLHDNFTSSESFNFAYNEASSALNGLWSSLDAIWINDPEKDNEAARKPYQLKVASETGLKIPETLITSDPTMAHAFIQKHGPQNTIYKAFTATIEAWRETRILHTNELRLIENVKYAPVIFQQYIPVRYDLRVTIIGTSIFCSAVGTNKSNYPIDYRMELDDLNVKQFELPSEISKKLLKLMSRLGLRYGAIDLRVTPDNEIYFLEVNPSGQWLFMENRTGQKITNAFCDYVKELVG